MRAPLMAFLMAATPLAAEVPVSRAAEAAMEQLGDTAGLARWVADFRPRALAAGIAPDTIDRAMSDLAYNPDVIRRDRRQNEFTKTIWDYLDTAVSEDRVTRGRAALARHADLLARIEAEYGVEKEVVVALWGLESAYGGFRGDVPTIAALATLAYDGRRAAFFERELIAALRILQEGHVTPDRMTGSWAGAMGHTQFMPTSFLALAVDFTGNGRRDVWGDDPADALASAAAYLRHHGWRQGMPWGVEVRLPKGFDYAGTGEQVVRPVADWQAAGVRLWGGGDLPDHGPGAVLLPAGHRGAAFLIWPNFQVIERYNPADAYVIAIGHLSDRLRGGPPVGADWPRDDRALTLPERITLQERLTAAGFDTKGIDGRIGPNTIAAVRAFQAARGMVPDGYASPALLAALP
ncbi:MAG: lytic murein transglycosylase [Paracoccaceae bacterium]|nr:MAG: lytic murein transglycosylase [Paracoccaceae bacterium]